MYCVTRFLAIAILPWCLPLSVFSSEREGAAPSPVFDTNAQSGARSEESLSKPGWTLTFQDEFDSDTLNEDLWNLGRTKHKVKHKESTLREIYPYELNGGVLKLRVEKRKTPDATKAEEFRSENFAPYTAKAIATYTAPAIATWGKFTQAYGWFEARCKMPKALGIWEGFWLYPEKPRPEACEIDIFESLTRWDDKISLAIHPKLKGVKSWGKGKVAVPGLSDDFHVYAVNWEPGKVTYYVDGKPVGEYLGKGVPSAPLYIIVSCRTGGWAGDAVDEGALPDDFEIDYVRVYRKETE